MGNNSVLGTRVRKYRSPAYPDPAVFGHRQAVVVVHRLAAGSGPAREALLLVAALQGAGGGGMEREVAEAATAKRHTCGRCMDLILLDARLHPLHPSL